MAKCAQDRWVIQFKYNLPTLLHSQWYELAAELNNVQLTNTPDQVKWLWEKSGKFSVKSVYDRMRSRELGKGYKHIWKARIPEKIMILMWLTEYRAILTKDNMIKRNWKCDPICYFCSEREGINHLMFECNVTKVV